MFWASRMYWQAGCLRCTGTILWARASVQVILPFLLLVHRVSAYASGVGLGGCSDMLLLGVQRGVLQHGGIFPVWFGIAGSVTRKVKSAGSAEVIS